MAFDLGDFIAKTAPIFVAGSGVQALVAWLRRRNEVRKLDTETDSVAVRTMQEVVATVNGELDKARARITELEAQLGAEKRARTREVNRLAGIAEKAQADAARAQAEASDLRTDVALLRAEVTRLRGVTP